MNRVRGTRTIDFRPRQRGLKSGFGGRLQALNPAKPGTNVVPTRGVLVHHLPAIDSKRLEISNCTNAAEMCPGRR